MLMSLYQTDFRSLHTNHLDTSILRILQLLKGKTEYQSKVKQFSVIVQPDIE